MSVSATDAAVDVIKRLREKHGPLLFHQSGGCCDGSAPICLEEGDLLIGDGDVLVGTVSQMPFYMSREQYEYWKAFDILLDVKEGRGGMFSLESAVGSDLSPLPL
ncbi:DUF779 domain-containing protein [Rossellomorea marisflavi]|uniref:DUF779 domain-containing protein n=1 Tax=Rossellomorea marisflavi TaxID=189381 RepID=UPI0028531A13|nr:DUF779 domain-containing protein [Rossellomorea marisflavi]MDR4935773.1 DUF779 domain-containing protein [Rossellomorea marisflavi]